MLFSRLPSKEKFAHQCEAVKSFSQIAPKCCKASARHNQPSGSHKKDQGRKQPLGFAAETAH
jgi:hypothetical protein